ncbi:hypothetical protein C5167_013258 [Papaver somniferum]|uniref:Uncharacterized protein n=1 Tax=Papaver somniferum TaxID=3469 RepID=A0A4Y7IZS5_PAPSO|nr:hypothetical protein C5167_013258 [Papaver somniferum]
MSFKDLLECFKKEGVQVEFGEGVELQGTIGGVNEELKTIWWGDRNVVEVRKQWLWEIVEHRIVMQLSMEGIRVFLDMGKGCSITVIWRILRREGQFDWIKSRLSMNSEVVSVNLVHLKAGTPLPTVSFVISK